MCSELDVYTRLAVEGANDPTHLPRAPRGTRHLARTLSPILKHNPFLPTLGRVLEVMINSASRFRKFVA
jgi:hypothetical protein